MDGVGKERRGRREREERVRGLPLLLFLAYSLIIALLITRGHSNIYLGIVCLRYLTASRVAAVK